MPKPVKKTQPSSDTLIIPDSSCVRVMAEPPASRLNGVLTRIRTGSDEIEIGSSDDVPDDVEGATMDDVAKLIASVRYLIRDWIPFGMVTGIIAEPGAGKSAFALWLARTVMTGGRWFNGTQGLGKPGYVLWCPTENDMAITLHRMQEWAIPQDRLLLPFKDDPLRPINLADASHMKRMEALVNKYKTPMVVVDSLRGGHDSDENCSRVGRMVQGLAGIAERTKAAMILVHHTRKLSVDEEITANSSRGSNAILALMRSQLGIDKPDPTSRWCRIRVLKENLGLRPNPVGFQVTGTGLEFGDAPEKPRTERETKKAGAAEWLKGRMDFGTWYLATEIQNKATADGYSPNALQRAREDLGITVANGNVRTNEDRKSEWRLGVPMGEEGEGEEITRSRGNT